MPLTVTNFNSENGYFELADERGKLVGTGRAKASRQPGMITLFFDRASYRNLNKGLRLPINWLNESE